MPALLSARWESGSLGWRLGSPLELCWGREDSLQVLCSAVYHHPAARFSARFTGRLWGPTGVGLCKVLLRITAA